MRTESLRRFRGDTDPIIPVPARPRPGAPNRGWPARERGRRRADHECRLAVQCADDEARRERAHPKARARRLDELADEVDIAWSRIEAMIATGKPAEHDAALTLFTDLQALAEREDR